MVQFSLKTIVVGEKVGDLLLVGRFLFLGEGGLTLTLSDIELGSFQLKDLFLLSSDGALQLIDRRYKVLYLYLTTLHQLILEVLYRLLVLTLRAEYLSLQFMTTLLQSFILLRLCFQLV